VVRAQPQEVRFFRMVAKTDTCWLYTGYKMKTGYAQFYVGPRNSPKALMLVHRWSYQHHRGPIPDGHEVHHTCGVRHCVNPEHLATMPRSEHNLQPGHCGFLNAVKERCPQGHEYTGLKGKSRHCQVCDTLRHRARHRAKNPAAPARPWRYKYESAA
jgi:hypothetical protein